MYALTVIIIDSNFSSIRSHDDHGIVGIQVQEETLFTLQQVIIHNSLIEAGTAHGWTKIQLLIHNWCIITWSYREKEVTTVNFLVAFEYSVSHNGKFMVCLGHRL